MTASPKDAINSNSKNRRSGRGNLGNIILIRKRRLLGVASMLRSMTRTNRKFDQGSTDGVFFDLKSRCKQRRSNRVRIIEEKIWPFCIPDVVCGDYILSSCSAKLNTRTRTLSPLSNLIPFFHELEFLSRNKNNAAEYLQ